MQLAIPFALENEYNEIADEFNILFRIERNSPDKLLEFLEAFPDKRINISMDYIDIPTLKMATQAHDKVYTRLVDIRQYQAIDDLREKEIPFFFGFQLNPCRSVSDFDFFAELGVTDIYPADDLMYDLENMKEMADSRGIGTRIILNKLPYTLPDRNPKVPWFSPDCVDLLEPYFDTAEFDIKFSHEMWHQFGVYYRAWFERQDWHGDLNELYKDLDIFIPNDSLFSYDLIKYKIHCKRHCANANSSCRKCEQYLEIAEDFNSKSIGIVKG